MLSLPDPVPAGEGQLSVMLVQHEGGCDDDNDDGTSTNPPRNSLNRGSLEARNSLNRGSLEARNSQH